VKKLVLATAAVVAAVVVFIVITVPPRRQQLPPSTDGTIPGILHVHSNRSDGLSSPDEIAQAAARAGLKFLVFTDHGDATRLPDPPTYRAGVLCLDAVEISTNGGHYVAIDMSPSPYPLGGEARDVVDDVHRLGGFGVAAHPDSPKPQLRWRDWTAPFDGIEMVNLDTVWREWVLQAGAPSTPASGRPTPWDARRRILAALFDYPFRPAETIARLIQPSTIVDEWAAQAERRRIVMLAGADAHAKLALRGDPADNQYVLAVPGYESAFRTMSVHVALDRPLSGNAATDAPSLIGALRSGHLYTAIDGIATPPSLEVTASSGPGTARAGDELRAGSQVTLRVRSNAPRGFTTTVWKGATALSADHRERDFTVAAGQGPGVYWVEIRSTDGPEPLSWIRSNPVYVRDPAATGRVPTRPVAAVSQALFDGTSIAGWGAEHDPTSLAVVEAAPTVGGTELRLRFGLAGGAPAGQVVTLVRDLPDGVASHDRVTFAVRAERPMRLAVQLRGGVGDSNNDRWQRSVYVDTVEQERTVFFDDFLPVGATHSSRPPLDRIRMLLFAIDMTNTKPGTSGRLWLKRVVLQH
jgi:PHP domain-containing protein